MAEPETDTTPAHDSISMTLIHHLRSLTRFILVKTEEEHSFIKSFSQHMAKQKNRTWVFNAEYGLQMVSEYLRVKTLSHDSASSFSCIQKHSREDMLNAGHNAMNTISADNPGADENFYLVTDPETWFDDSLMARRLINLSIQLQEDQKVVKCLIFIGHPSVTIPKKLRYLFETVEYELSKTEIEYIVRDLVESFGGIEMPQDLSIFRGLTTFEIGSAITQSIVKTVSSAKTAGLKPRIDPDFIKRYKDTRLVSR